MAGHEVRDVSPASELEAHAAAAESFLRSIANRHRLMVLCSLVEGEISAGELSRRLGLTQSNLSRHLGTLREEGLVATRREATTIYYRIASDRVRTILQTLHGMFCAGPDGVSTQSATPARVATASVPSAKPGGSGAFCEAACQSVRRIAAAGSGRPIR